MSLGEAWEGDTSLAKTRGTVSGVLLVSGVELKKQLFQLLFSSVMFEATPFDKVC